jgi:hypothetical protein
MEPRPARIQPMFHRTSSRVFVIALMAVIVSLIIMPSLQRANGGTGRSGLQVFKGGGGELSAGRKSGPPPLTALDVKTLAGMVGSQPGTVFAKLTPHTPSIGNKAALVFVDPKLVESGADYAVWGPPQTEVNAVGADGSLVLWLKPWAGHKYLIDCAVLSASPHARFVVTGPQGSAPMEVGAISSGQHLTFVLDAIDSKWVSFRISGTGQQGSVAGMSTFFVSPVEWTFYSCEITNL